MKPSYAYGFLTRDGGYAESALKLPFSNMTAYEIAAHAQDKYDTRAALLYGEQDVDVFQRRYERGQQVEWLYDANTRAFSQRTGAKFNSTTAEEPAPIAGPVVDEKEEGLIPVSWAIAHKTLEKAA